jgi:hypothetical protein
MECPECKEEIKDGAKMCKICKAKIGKWAFWRKSTDYLKSLLAILIPVGSLGLAVLEFHAKNIAVAAKDIAEQEVALTKEILEAVPREAVMESARSEIGPEIRGDDPAYRFLETGEYSAAEREFKEIIRENPEDTDARKALIYTKILGKRE